MSAEWTVSLCSDDTQRIFVEWIDHNNLQEKMEIELGFSQEKPRKLYLSVNGARIAEFASKW